MKDALQNGWNGIIAPAPDMFSWSEPSLEAGYKKVCEMSPFLDPAFWQALSKARGWNKESHKQTTFWTMQYTGGSVTLLDEHEIVWHSFIYHLSLGKDAESFFAELLAK